MNRNDLGMALKRLVDDTWKSEQRPVLLSDLPVQLKLQAPDADYKNIIGQGSLKEFVKASGEEFGYQLVEHPTQRAKLGLVPAGEHFSFRSEHNDENMTEAGKVKKDRDGVALMRLLARLPDSDLEKISIPISVLVKLFR